MIRNILDWLRSILNKPTPVPVPQPPQPTGDFVNQLLVLHNNHRQSLGLQPLKLSNVLNQAAQNHSNWMSQKNNLSHDENGIDPGVRLTHLGYNWSAYGENIAMGYANASAVFAGWLKSSGHRHNIEDSMFTEVGFGLAGTYWTTDFAHPR